MRIETYQNGQLIEIIEDQGNERVRIVNGQEVERRPLTSDEIATNTAAALADTQLRNGETLRQQSRTAIDAILASRETLRAINAKTNAQITGGDTKQVARELMRTQKELLAVLRLVGGSLDSASTGAD